MITVKNRTALDVTPCSQVCMYNVLKETHFYSFTPEDGVDEDSRFLWVVDIFQCLALIVLRHSARFLCTLATDLLSTITDLSCAETFKIDMSQTSTLGLYSRPCWMLDTQLFLQPHTLRTLSQVQKCFLGLSTYLTDNTALIMGTNYGYR